MKNDISQPWLLTSSPVPPEEGNAGPHVAQSGSGLLLASTEHIANSSQPLVVDACWPSVWLSTSVCVCVNVWLKCLLTRLWHPPSANSLFDSLQTTRWCSERETERKKKKATGLRTSINEPPIQRLIMPPGTMIVLTHHPPPLWSWFPHFLCSVLRWVAAGNAADKWSKKYRECERDGWREAVLLNLILNSVIYACVHAWR